MYVQRLCVKPVSFLSCLCPLFRCFLLFLVAVALGHPRVIPANLTLESIFLCIPFQKNYPLCRHILDIMKLVCDILRLVILKRTPELAPEKRRTMLSWLVAPVGACGVLHLDALKSCGCSGLWVVSDRFCVR